MSLSTTVKINQINNLSDARYCAGMGVQLLGFNLQPGHLQAIDTHLYQAIRGWLAGVAYVAEMGYSSIEQIAAVHNELLPDYIETEDYNLLPELTAEYSVIFKTSLTNFIQMDLERKVKALKKMPEYVHLVASTQDLDQYAVAKIASWRYVFPVLLEYQFTPDNIHSILASTQAKGIVLTGGNEEAPGLKNFDDLSLILEALETED
jgi:phosphoribosylanthranilate isomerase